MGGKPRRVAVETVTPGKLGTRIDGDKYDAMKAAILAVVPASADGVVSRDLPGRLRRELPAELFANASVTWYYTTVKLDLEAKRLIERVPGSRPQRLRRA